MIRSIFKSLSYAIFPRRCSFCGEVVAVNEDRCEDCNNLKAIVGEVCAICGASKENCNCTKKTKTPEYKQVVSPYYFDEKTAKAIHRFKLYGYTELAAEMGKDIASTVQERYGDISFDAIVYVPMAEKHLNKRGYNQSYLLANEASKILEVPLVDALVKIRETKTQRGSTARERNLNLFGAFDINENVNLQDKNVLLIDDVKTTGSTLNECSVMLKACGATVYCATLAVTNKK